MSDITTKEQEYKAFLEFHGPQLKAMGFPEDLERKLFAKLRFEDYDLGEKVQMMYDEENEKMYLRTIDEMKTNQDVFLIDHAWTFKQRTAYKTLKENEKLFERLENIMKNSAKQDLPVANPYEKPKPTLAEQLKKYEESKEPVLAYDLEYYKIVSLKDIKFREEVEEINLWGNEILDPNNVTQILMKLPNLKALYMNENPCATNCSNFNVVGDVFDKLEIINSSLTCKANDWAMLFYAKDTGAKTMEEIVSLDLSGKNILALNNLDFLKKMTNLKIFDISDNVDMYKPRAMLEAEAKQRAEGSGQEFDFIENKHDRDVMLHNIPSVEHLICDIMLEAYVLDTRPHRQFLPNLKTINRVPINMLDLGHRTKEKKLLSIMDDMWKYVNTYRLVKPGKMDQEPTFYINDEVGTSISHSDTPNCKVFPLIYSPNCEADDVKTTTFSVMWPTTDIKKEDYIYRDYLQGIDESKWRSARLLPWFNVFDEYFAEEYKKFQAFVPPFNAMELHEQYQTDYPAPSQIEWDASQGPIPVYSDYIEVQEYLKDPRFQIIDDPKKAKILWLTEDYETKKFLDWEINYETTYVNFFKKEGALVIKNQLANMVNTTLVDKSCIQQTFDLDAALPQFVGAYNDRQKKRQENTWIVKPASMARSMDTWVTNNINQIIRLVETGPKIAQKYIDRPITFKNKKIDLRYVVVLKSLFPLQLSLTSEFYIRFGNNDFTMAENTFHEYDTHFTVMNYEGKDMVNLRCEEFIKQFDQEYESKGVKFADLNKKVYKAITDVFIAFQARYGKDVEALGNIDKARGLYGVDVMIDQDYNAKLLEVTFAPDMHRFCLFQPEGYNEVFGHLFFNEEKGMIKLV